ncbi:polysaccharide biosynthesis tyrosine autokinase [Modestobacter sp. VKM Ac-2978]|uniref:polysaccharide biosynthesis tyrosine autokinase n=1 Tax=Modestobacter sp. VKM Ac-2978 TaxID=3004132 RepID=UPI0022AA76EF|nr:polysaccharide biosynthesis tyrosine autokinase [Modestobacter sp. VKM Ac-2978]MCZ2846582.1 polysaccharide biosynthesis tyrosine autokinase [Modestobacter sp. VKM Ac-2978]
MREVLSALRVGWWLPTVGLVTGGVVALAISLLQTPLYTSDTQLFVSTTDSTSTSDVFTGSQFSQQRVTSYAQLLTGEELAARVIDRLDLDVTAAELTAGITATAVTDTVLINVSVTHPSPERTQQIAATLGAEFIAFVGELETPEAGPSPVRVAVTDSPEVPTVPSSPQTARNVALGLLVGLLIGAALAIARVRLDRSVRDAEEAAELAGAPVIGVILRDEALVKEHTIDQGSSSRTAEAYRQLRTNLQFLNVDEPPKAIMISSAVPSEGKTTVAVNLALALAEAGRSVTLVEGDLRRPRVTRYLGMVGGAGLTNILSGSAELEDVLQPYGDGDLKVIAAGPTPPNPSELLASSHMFTLIDDLRAKNDFVLIDAPPLLPVADASGLAVIVDGVVLSTRYGSTRKEQLQQARATLDRVGARTLGIILNIVPPKAEVSSAYGYGYNYGYDADRGGAHAAR